MMRDIEAVIPAAGAGTRMRPLTRGISKEMLPIGDKPIIHHVLNEVPTDVPATIVAHPKKRDLLDYISYLIEEYDWKIKVTFQSERNGLADAIYSSLSYVEKNTMYVALPDEYFKVGENGTMNHPLFYLMTRAMPSLLTVEVSQEECHMYGMVFTKEGKVTTIVEKPKDSVRTNLAAVGRYVLPVNEFVEQYDVLVLDDARNPFEDNPPEFNDILNGIVDNGEDIYVQTAKKEDRFDCGSKEGYNEAFKAIV